MTGDSRISVSLPHLRSLQAAARGISFLPRQPARSVLSGRHASRLRGRGLNFEEMRNYLPGDDVRSIDWKATARTGSPHVRVFTEERDRPALLVVDQRMSMFFGSVHNMKSVTAAEAAAIAAFTILRANDRVGGIVFNDAEQLEFAPKRSQATVFAFLEAIGKMNNILQADKIVERSPGRLNTVLESISRTARHDHLVIVFSDFDGIDDTTHRRFSTIAQHNDVVLALIHDPIAERIEPGQRAIIGNGVLQAEVDLSSTSTLHAVSGYMQERLALIYAWQKEIQLSVLPVTAGEETLPQLRRLMGQPAAVPSRR